MCFAALSFLLAIFLLAFGTVSTGKTRRRLFHSETSLQCGLYSAQCVSTDCRVTSINTSNAVLYLSFHTAVGFLYRTVSSTQTMQMQCFYILYCTENSVFLLRNMHPSCLQLICSTFTFTLMAAAGIVLSTLPLVLWGMIRVICSHELYQKPYWRLFNYTLNLTSYGTADTIKAFYVTWKFYVNDI